MRARFRSLLTACLLFVAAGTLAPSPAHAADASITVNKVTITTHDGVKLDGLLAVPDTPGPRPVVVAPAAWGEGAFYNILAISALAKRGYVAISYAGRGFDASGGVNDVAVPDEVKDVSDVIDYVLANTKADPSRIGLTGLSYAGGLTLLAAAAEPRIKAVVAMSAWTSLEDAFFPNGARADFLVNFLYLFNGGKEKSSAGMTQAYENFIAGRNLDSVREFARQRSAGTFIDKINHNGTAVMMAQEWNDVAYPPSQVGEFFDKLTVKHKFLEVRPGDHASQSSMFILNGLWSQKMITNLGRWFDANLIGNDTSIFREKPVVLQPRSSGIGPAEERYNTWAETQAAATKYGLGKPEGFIPTGTIAKGTPAPWSQQVTAGFNLASATPLPLIGNYLVEGLFGRPATTNLDFITRNEAVVFNSPSAGERKMRGSATAHLAVTPSAPDGLVMGYLYEQDQFGGNAYLLQHMPYVWHGATPGQPLSMTLKFPPTAYDIPAGHRLALVFTTQDWLVHDENQPGAAITFGSTAADPAWVSWPLR
jgi:predicted acyl esterase